jgi:mRNA-capping enzyme
MGNSKPKRHSYQANSYHKKRKYIPPRYRKKYFRKRVAPDFPKGWIHCSKYGDEVANTHIIPLKCPLSHHKYPDSDFIVEQRDLNRKIGLIIDLTFTTKYYSLHDLPKSVKYIKFKLQGHTVIILCNH